MAKAAGTYVRSDNVRTPMFIGAHIDVAEMTEYQGKMAYRIEMLFPKSTDMSALTAVIKALREKAFPKLDPKYVHSPIIDGDEPNKKGVVADYKKGHWIIRAKTSIKPTLLRLVNGKAEIVDNPFIFQSGNFCKADVSFGAYNNESIGINCNLNALVKLGEGTPLDMGHASVDPSSWDDSSMASATPAASLGLDL